MSLDESPQIPVGKYDVFIVAETFLGSRNGSKTRREK